MSNKCPVCDTELKENLGQYPAITGGRQAFDCPRCGIYMLSRSIADDLLSILKHDIEKIAILSHGIRKMQRDGKIPYLDSYLVQLILQGSLPSLTEQMNNLVLWLGERTIAGKLEWIQPSTHQAIMGAVSPEGFSLVVKRLIDKGLIRDEPNVGSEEAVQMESALTFDGWNYFDQLNRGALISRRAFMAMKYGDPVLDKIVNEHFRPAIVLTGFDLYRLDDIPKAGFAEGLGKPVIYTCERGKFEGQKTHFDTNHHLTVIWDKDRPELAAEQLKATIRATLPDEAKLIDE